MKVWWQSGYNIRHFDRGISSLVMTVMSVFKTGRESDCAALRLLGSLFLAACLHEACWNKMSWSLPLFCQVLIEIGKSVQMVEEAAWAPKFPEIRDSPNHSTFWWIHESNMSSERMCHGQVTMQYTGKYPELSCSSEQSGSVYAAVCGDQPALILHFQLRQSLADPAVVKQLILL